MNKKHIMNAFAAMLMASAIGLTTAACGDDDDNVKVPDNWVTVSSDAPITVGYQGTGDSNIEVDYTLAAGLDGKVPYVVNHEAWCQAFINDGKLYVKIDESDNVHGRNTTFDLMYDTDHKVTFSVNQGKAPVVSVTGFDTSGIPGTINMGEALDLNDAISVLPANASFKTLAYELVEGDNVVTLSGSSVIGKNPGEAKIRVIATSDDEVVGAGISQVVTVKVKGDLKLSTEGYVAHGLYTFPSGKDYQPDGSTGMPNDIFDGKLNTYYSTNKPGKNGAPSSGYTPGLIIDMQSEVTFNYFYWGHRSTNSYAFLRPEKMNVYGSHDGSTYEFIKEIAVEQTTNTTYSLDRDCTYRYLKFEFSKYSTSSGGTLQVAEFYLGRLME